MKISSLLGLGVVLVLIAAFAWSASTGRAQTVKPAPPATAVAAVDPQVVRADSHVLGERGSTGVTVVEFLDFECEGCLAAYPLVERLRQQYAGRVTFVARYFPLPGHANAMNAALAVEAAAQQGRFEAMYQRMYQTQGEWGEQQVSAAATFRGYADSLGLDLGAYDRAVNDPATRERIEKDVADGLGLGLEGTPTFYLDGQRLEPTSEQDFLDAIERAVTAAESTVAPAPLPAP
ncbi:DsbA family protein [Kineococcus radiotolerans]|uniref:DsbA family protein n=1 Tax=Kineococcus radiotolerans TaxID=131568 RepID=UPI00003A3E2C|nr:thioredoxin domain-containing protein [Kineococcus radiotolerans]